MLGDDHRGAGHAAGVEILDLSVSNPTRADLHYDAEAILASLVRPGALDYDPLPRGLLSARQAVADYYRSDHQGYDLDPDSIVLTTSTSEGYSYIFRLLCNPGDEILVPKPSYPLFEFLADLQDVHLVPFPLLYVHGWQIDLPSLYQAVTQRTRGVVLVHPNNPTGYLYSRKEMEALKDICLRHDLYLFSDEAYREFCYDGQYVSAMHLSGLEQNVVLMDTISKRYSACGARIGAQTGSAKAHLPVSHPMEEQHELSHHWPSGRALRPSFRPA